METFRTSSTKAVCMSSWSVCTRSSALWRHSGSGVGRWSAWALWSLYSSTSTLTTPVRWPVSWENLLHRLPNNKTLFFISDFQPTLLRPCWSRCSVTRQGWVGGAMSLWWGRSCMRAPSTTAWRATFLLFSRFVQLIEASVHNQQEVGDENWLVQPERPSNIQSFFCLLPLQVVEELVGKWRSFPEAQHIPLCAHLLGLALKTVTQLCLGEHFRDDAKVISFRKNHDVVWEFILDSLHASLFLILV